MICYTIEKGLVLTPAIATTPAAPPFHHALTFNNRRDVDGPGAITAPFVADSPPEVHPGLGVKQARIVEVRYAEHTYYFVRFVHHKDAADRRVLLRLDDEVLTDHVAAGAGNTWFLGSDDHLLIPPGSTITLWHERRRLSLQNATGALLAIEDGHEEARAAFEHGTHREL